MFDFCRKYIKLLIPILLGMFFVVFVIDDYADEPQKTKGFFTECFAEVDVDETEIDEDDIAEEPRCGQCVFSPQKARSVFLCTLHISSSKQSDEQFRGLVRRYAPRPFVIYTELFNNGMNLLGFMPFFYFDNQIINLWILQVF